MRSGEFSQSHFNPRTGELTANGVVRGGKRAVISAPAGDQEDWLIVVRRK